MLALARFVAAGLTALALIAPGAGAGVESPPTPQEVVDRHAVAAQSIAGQSAQALQNAAQMAVAVIGTLDSNGASDAEILRAGRRALDRNRSIAERSLGVLRRATETALRALNRLDAPGEFAAAVRSAADAARAAIRASAEASAAAIRAAVDAAVAE